MCSGVRVCVRTSVFVFAVVRVCEYERARGWEWNEVWRGDNEKTLHWSDTQKERPIEIPI